MGISSLDDALASTIQLNRKHIKSKHLHLLFYFFFLLFLFSPPFYSIIVEHLIRSSFFFLHLGP